MVAEGVWARFEGPDEKVVQGLSAGRGRLTRAGGQSRESLIVLIDVSVRRRWRPKPLGFGGQIFEGEVQASVTS